MRQASTGALIGLILFQLAICIAAIWGYVWNVIKIFGALNEPITAMFVARCFGVVAFPLGVVFDFYNAA